jgi:hypothetical protein
MVTIPHNQGLIVWYYYQGPVQNIITQSNPRQADLKRYLRNTLIGYFESGAALIREKTVLTRRDRRTQSQHSWIWSSDKNTKTQFYDLGNLFTGRV